MQIKRHLGALLGYVNISLKYIFNFVAICKSLFEMKSFIFFYFELFWKKDGISSFDAFSHFLSEKNKIGSDIFDIRTSQ